ncbi:hypothetical protein [Deinococcus sp.]|uniref:hypothetical protein n=1 Tax=Deinococcus sp. TaxID=47478 RepID=UPI0025F16BAE|nr:hypothetical protein [Deinococcus sp.]
MNATSAPALSRTFAIVTTYRECSVVTEVSRDSVTLSREEVGAPLSAQVNGQAASLSRAVRLLQNAQTVTLTAEVLPAAPIGNPRAHQLHRVMGRVGIPAAEHYAFARAATDDHSIYSLAALSAPQADAVWAYLCSCYPAAANQAVSA